MHQINISNVQNAKKILHVVKKETETAKYLKYE